MIIENKSKIFVAVPHTGNIRGELTAVLIHWSHNENHPNYNVMIDISYGQPLQHNRNKIIKEFLNTDCTHIFMLDSDIIPKVDCIDNLLNHNKDIVGALCFSTQDGDTFPVAMRLNNKKTRLDDGLGKFKVIKTFTGLEEVDATGCSALLVKRKVFEHPKMKFPFKFEYDEEGLLLNGEDFNWCLKAKDLGFKIYVDAKTLCSHFQTIDLMKVNTNMGKEINKTKKETYESLISLTKKNQKQIQELKKLNGNSKLPKKDKK